MDLSTIYLKRHSARSCTTTATPLPTFETSPGAVYPYFVQQLAGILDEAHSPQKASPAGVCPLQPKNATSDIAFLV
jgi:hypothetical protein